MIILASINAVGVKAQTEKKTRVNARIPDIKIENVINFSKPVVALTDFQKDAPKLVIFDFWMTSCVPCVRQFPKLDSLQKEFSANLQIVLVTIEKKEKIKEFLANWEKKNHIKFSIPIVTDDTLINSYIFRGAMPHYAWIAPNNVLFAQTSSAMMTREAIAAYLKKMKDEYGHLKTAGVHQ